MNLFDISNLEKRLRELENKTLEDGFWNDTKTSSNVLEEIKKIKHKIDKYSYIKKEILNLRELSDLIELEYDEDIKKEIIEKTNVISNEFIKFETDMFLSGKYDSNNAIITIHPGARRNRITRLG